MTLNGNLTQESALEKHFLSVQVSELFFLFGNFISCNGMVPGLTLMCDVTRGFLNQSRLCGAPLWYSDVMGCR